MAKWSVVTDVVIATRARALYEHWLPLILYENRLCGLRATKVLMHVGGIIESEATRSPLPPLSPLDPGRASSSSPADWTR